MARCSSSQETQLHSHGNAYGSLLGKAHLMKAVFTPQSWGNGLCDHNMGTPAVIKRIRFFPHLPSVIIFLFFKGIYTNQAVFLSAYYIFIIK